MDGDGRWKDDDGRCFTPTMSKTCNAKIALCVFDISLPSQDESSSDWRKAAAKGHK